MFYLLNSVFKLQMISVLDLSHRGIRNEFRAELMNFYFFCMETPKRKEENETNENQNGEPSRRARYAVPSAKRIYWRRGPTGHWEEAARRRRNNDSQGPVERQVKVGVCVCAASISRKKGGESVDVRHRELWSEKPLFSFIGTSTLSPSTRPHLALGFIRAGPLHPSKDTL